MLGPKLSKIGKRPDLRILRTRIRYSPNPYGGEYAFCSSPSASVRKRRQWMANRNKGLVLSFQSRGETARERSTKIPTMEHFGISLAWFRNGIETPRTTTLGTWNKRMKRQGATYSVGGHAGRQFTISGRDFVSLKRRNWTSQREEAWVDLWFGFIYNTLSCLLPLDYFRSQHYERLHPTNKPCVHILQTRERSGVIATRPE